MEPLIIKDDFPDELFHLSASELADYLKQPTLFHLKGKLADPLFFSVLLHGNEDTGWKMIQQLLKKYTKTELPRSVSVFIGNIHAAKYNLRRLENQPDFNRIWQFDSDLPEYQMAETVYIEMQQRGIFASVDIHNNTGKNPFYGCINRLEVDFIKLAYSFAEPIIYFQQPASVQSNAFSKLCPAITLECGQPGSQAGVDFALNYAERLLNLENFDQLPMPDKKPDILHTFATVKIPPFIDYAYENKNCEVSLKSDLEEQNFKIVPKNSVIAESKVGMPFVITNEKQEDITNELFYEEKGQIKNKVDIIPSMVTLNIDVIRQDCYCYLMEPFEY